MRERARSINNTTDFLITPTMYAPLETSLVLRKGTGDPTWSRATKAWGFNELGYLEELPSGCAFFGGARLVRNRLGGNSDNYSSGVPNSVTIVNASEPNHRGTNTAVRYAVTPGLDFHFVRSNILANDYPGGATLRATVVVSRNLYRYIGIRAGQTSGSEVIDLQTNTWVTNRVETLHRSFEIIDANWIRLTTSAYFAATATKVFDITPASPTGLEYWTAPAGLEFVIADAQLNNISNYDASYIPEYVSVGVEASPYFGAGIDGAKYFSTDYTGGRALTNLDGFRREAAATNNLLFNRYFQGGAGTINQGWFIAQGSGADLITNGEFATDTGWTKGVGWTISGGTAVATAVVNNQLTQNIGAVAGKTYTITFTLGAGWSGVLFCAIGGVSSPIATTRANAAGTYSFHCIAGSSTPGILYFYPNSACTGTIDNVSVRESVIQVTQATGLDGIANTATTLTAGAADAIILQPTSGIASAARCASAYVKRRTGTGTISFTQDGTNWTDITSQINGSTWSRVQITSTLANPSVGFKISTSGDAIDVDCVQNEAGAVATSPIVTTTTTITRDADSLTYQTSGNWSDTVGTAYVEVEPLAYSGGAIGSATNGLLLSTSNSGATAFDGTNAANGPTGTPGTSEKLALNWTGAVMEVASSATVGTPGTYDGAMGLSNIGIGVGASGYFKNVAVYPYALSDADMVKITT